MKFIKGLGLLFFILAILGICEALAQTQDSRPGDEAALEALYTAANGSNWKDNTGWSSSGMSLSDTIYGVTVASINGELRVTKIDLHYNGLTGSIDVPEIGNLKQMKLFTVTFNSLNTTIPSELGNCTNLEYLYLARSNGHPTNSDAVAMRDTYPHIWAQEPGDGDVHPGKEKGDEHNVFTGAVPANLGNLKNLKWFILNWTDSAKGATDGISSVPSELFNIFTLEGLQIFDNNNIADMPFPSGITQMSNLQNLALGAGKSGRNTGFLTGSLPAGFGNLSNLWHVRFNENPNLTINFDNLDLSGMTSLRKLILSFTDTKGAFPDQLIDGTLPDVMAVTFAWPQGSGMTGKLPATIKSGLVILDISGQHIRGDVPVQLWENSPGIILPEFYYNNLTSFGTSDLTMLDRIRNIEAPKNNIGPEPWLNLAWGTSKLRNFARADFSGNQYVFSNMLWKPSNGGGKTIFELYKANATTKFLYKNQQPFGQPRTISYTVGNDVTIDDFDGVVTHADNVYQWQKDGADISGAASRDLTITNAQSSDAGTYTLIVTNPGVPGLTLTSQPIKLKNIKDS